MARRSPQRQHHRAETSQCLGTTPMQHRAPRNPAARCWSSQRESLGGLTVDIPARPADGAIAVPVTIACNGPEGGATSSPRRPRRPPCVARAARITASHESDSVLESCRVVSTPLALAAAC